MQITSTTKNFKQLVLLVLLNISLLGSAYAQPGDVPNIQTAPAGSLVIAMDNTLQSADGTNFNLKAYGLAVSLLNGKIKVRWIIKSGKTKDGIDFTASAERRFPSASAAASRNFKAGPFVIYTEDTTGSGAIINAFNASLPATQKVNVYRLTTSAVVDVRYELFRFGVPKAGILDEGGATGIHVGYMEDASIPKENYQVTSAATVNQKCFTFVSEPHNGKSGTFIDSVKKFVLRGGNFLAECAAIITYENYGPTGGFQTNGGYDNVNEDINDEVVYPYPDFAYTQFDGKFNPKKGGNTQTWSLNPGATTKNNWFSTARGGVQTGVYGATVSKLRPNFGGYVFYLGNHEYGPKELPEINGIRQYMNAFLIPSDPLVCSENTLPVSIGKFQGNYESGISKLNWVSFSEINLESYKVQRSQDGTNFISIGSVKAKGTLSTGSNTYYFNDNQPAAGTNYYRLMSVDNNGSFKYSNVIAINISFKGVSIRGIFPNPFVDKVSVDVTTEYKQTVEIRLTDVSGKTLRKDVLVAQKGANTFYLNDLRSLNGGVYIMEVRTGGQTTIKKLLKQ